MRSGMSSPTSARSNPRTALGPNDGRKTFHGSLRDFARSSGQDRVLGHRTGLAGFYCGSNHSNPVAGASMLERYLSAASTYAHTIDHLFILIAIVVGFWLIAP